MLATFRRRWLRKALLALGPALLVALVVTACGGGDGNTLTVYSGRGRPLVDPLLEEFTDKTGIQVRVRYASSAGIVATILEEGKNTPADVVFLQDPGGLGALAQEGILTVLPDELLDRVDPRFRSRSGVWVGTSGRARTVIYNLEAINPETDLPDTILGFTDPQWRGRIGWAPTNGSFQAFVTALRLQLGEEGARRWLEGIKANKPQVYPNNIRIVQAAAAGEIDVGFTNHYYLHRLLAERGEAFGARNFYLTGGDPGALVLVAGVGIIKRSDNQEAARRFVEFLLAMEGQTYFATETFELPLARGVPTAQGVPPLNSIEPPDIDLGNLADLRGTLDLLREVGILS